MLSSFSNFLPTALYTPPPLKADHIRLDEDDDDDDPSLKSDANPDKSHEMGVPVKNKSVNETFIFVRPPPAKSNHPLNLQVQLVPPKSRLPLGHTSALRQSLDMNASPPTTPVDSAPTTPDASYDWGAPLAPTMTSHSAASTYSGTTLVGARSTASIYSTATLVAPASTRRMIIPLYNLQAHNVMANIIVDAGTDAKVARFTKRGLEMIDLAVLEPVEVYPGAGSPTGDAPLRQSSSFSNRTVGGRPSISGSLGSRSSGRIDPTNASEAPLTPSSVRSQSQNEALPTPTRERFSEVAGAQATLPQQRNIFGKLFKKKDPGVPDSETPTLGGEDAAPGAIADLRTPVLGLTASVSSPVHPPKGRPGLYVWVVKRWLKDEGGLLAMAKGMVKGQGGYGELAAEVELRFEWKRGKAKRRTDTEKEEKRANLRSSQASVPAAQTEEDSGEESDPEDSETPWMCTVKVRQLVAHSQRALPLGREGRGGRNRERETDEAQGKKEMVRIKVGTLSPTPHHPKVVAMLKVPFPLPDVDVEQMVVHKREPSGARPGGARVILAEEIKDVVCSTGLWLAVRESFGGLGKVARKGDGWRIRGSYAQKQSDQSPPSPNLKHSLMSDDYGIRHVLPLLPPLTVPSPAPVVKFRDLPPSIHPLRVPSPATVQLLPPGSLLAENVTFPQGPLETRGDDGESNGAGGNGENNLFDLASDSTSPNAASSHSNPLGSKIMDAHPDGAPTTSSIPRGIYQEHREEDLNYLGPDKASVSSPVDPHSAVVLHSDPFGFRSPTADNQSDVSLTTSSIAKATDEDGARGDLVFRNETQIATFVIYIPDTLSTPTNDPTAIRPGDVRILEEHVPEGGNAVLAHMPTEPEDWVELHYDSALLNTIRSVGLGGPIPTMLSPETPALAIFGSILDDQVLELAKTLSDVSAFAVMVRSTEDDPLVKFMQAREIDIEMYPESGYSSEGSDNGTTGDDIESDADDSHSDSGDDYGIGGTFRPRGGALRKGKQKEVDPDYIIPAGIDRPDGFHCTRVKLHLQLHQDCLYDVAISSKTAFKFQTEKGETPHTLTEPISRPQVLSCVDLKVETRPFEVLLDRSYSNLGFIVHRQKSIAGREYLPRGFEPPSATATRSTQKSTENKGSLTFGLDSMQPVVTAKVSHGRTTGETVQLADDKPAPTCLVKEQIGKEWDKDGKSYSSYDVAWHPTAQTNGYPCPVNIRFGMGIEFFGKEERNITRLPTISHILRNQVILWVFDAELKAKVRGIVVLTTTYIPDIKIIEPLTIDEEEVIELRSHNPPATDNTSPSHDAANSVAIGLFEERPAVKSGMRKLMHRIAPKAKMKRPTLMDLPLHEYVARGWDATNEQWRNTVWPMLDQGFADAGLSSSAAWNLAIHPGPTEDGLNSDGTSKALVPAGGQIERAMLVDPPTEKDFGRPGASATDYGSSESNAGGIGDLIHGIDVETPGDSTDLGGDIDSPELQGGSLMEID